MVIGLKIVHVKKYNLVGSNYPTWSIKRFYDNSPQGMPDNLFFAHQIKTKAQL